VLTPTLDGGVSTQAVFLADPAITEASQATALTNPTTNPTLTKHGPGETDTRPMKALGYNGGTGSAPTLGETMTQGSATGNVVDFEGDGVSGTLLLESWNGTEFTNDGNITGGTSTFDATTNITGEAGAFYQEYTWELDAKGEAMTIVYDYQAARLAEDPVTAEFEPAIIWGGDEAAANQLLFFGAGGYFTPRAVRRWAGILQGDATADFSDNFDRADEDLSVSSNWNDVDNATNGARVLTNELGGDNSATTTNVGEVAAAAHALADDQYAQATVDALPTSGNIIGVACRIDTTRELCYAGILREGTPDTYEIALVDFSTSAGVFTTLATGSSTPATTDVMRLVAVGKTLVLFIDDVEEARYVDDEIVRTPILSGQTGVVFEGDAAPAGRLDDFATGDFSDDVINGEGVWVHDRGAGDIDFFTSDSGVTFTPPVSLTITVTGLVVGTEVRVCLTGTNTEVAGTESTVGTTFAFAIDSGVAVDIVVLNVDATNNVAYIPIRRENVSFTATGDFPVVMRLEPNFDAGI
jgi:hypothetical protein